jgi:mono/diheme cytochrome c family protein
MRGTILRIAAFVLGVIGIFAYVGQLLPQFEEHPPAKRAIGVTTSPQELAAIGEELVRVKGGCLVCHKVVDRGNERGPDLRQAAPKAAARKTGMAAEAYLIESLVDPNAFLVPGYPKMMPSAEKPPANLSKAEVKAVVAYLQVLGGGEVSVRIAPEDMVAAKAAGAAHRGRQLAEQHTCLGCHKIEGEGGEIGPEITRVAATREPAAILAKIRDPSIWTTPGFQAGLMPPDLAQTIPEGELHEIVAYLAQLAGKSYSPTGAASPWSHEGVRLGLVILAFNLGLLSLIALVGRRSKGEEAT